MVIILFGRDCPVSRPILIIFKWKFYADCLGQGRKIYWASEFVRKTFWFSCELSRVKAGFVRVALFGHIYPAESACSGIKCVEIVAAGAVLHELLGAEAFRLPDEQPGYGVLADEYRLTLEVAVHCLDRADFDCRKPP